MFNVAENIYWLPTQNASRRPYTVMIYCVSTLKMYLLCHISYHSKSPRFNGAEGIYWLPFYVCLGSNGPMISPYSCLTCGILVTRNLPHECQPMELIWDQMAAILQMTFSIAFSWLKMCLLLYVYHWNVFPGSILPYTSFGWDNGLAQNRR